MQGSREIGLGSWQILRTGSAGTVAPCYDWRPSWSSTFAQPPRTVRIRRGVPLLDLLGHDEPITEGDEPHRIALDPSGYRWFRVGSVNYALEWSRV